MTLRAGIVGWPVTHSLSPLLHGHWLKTLGIDGTFERLPAPPDAFADVIAKARADGFSGVNVTVPHKEAAFAIADTRDHSALEAGAANLLVFRPGGGIEAHNTDTIGLVRSLRAADVFVNRRPVVLLGAGGAARGAILALHQLGAGTIHILNRNAERARQLALSLANVPGKLVPGALSQWPQVAGDAALLVNTTSAGMTGNDPLNLDLSVLPQDAAVCDIVYNPLETPLLKDAAARGHKTIDGLGMLMHQAVPSFEAFFGVRPQVTPELRAVLVGALRAR